MALVIAEACNPLKALFSGTSASDIAGAAAEFVAAIADIQVLIHLKVQIISLTSRVQHVSARFQLNGAYIKQILDLVNKPSTSDTDLDMKIDLFLKRYKAYDPKIKRSELIGLEQSWKKVIEIVCNGLNKSDSGAGRTAATTPTYLCYRVPEQIALLFATYGEIYDSQFTLMEALASAARYEILQKGHGYSVTQKNLTS